MPYITKESRRRLEAGLVRADNPGDLNYQITKLCLQYLADKGLRYQHFNDIMGALEGAKLELYRRHVGPYEDIKIKENGDV